MSTAVEWTADTLHEHWQVTFALYQQRIDERFTAMDRATCQALDSAQRAVEKAERLADARAEAQDKLASERAHQQNEWRTVINDIGSRMVSQDAYNIAHAVMVEKIDRLNARVDRGEGSKTRTDTLVPWLIAAMGVIVAVISIVINFTQS